MVTPSPKNELLTFVSSKDMSEPLDTKKTLEFDGPVSSKARESPNLGNYTETDWYGKTSTGARNPMIPELHK
jgi:hypothetical protein